MTVRSGHIGAVIIAVVFGLLMAAAWLPSREDHAGDRKIVDGQGVHHLISNPLSHKSSHSFFAPSSNSTTTEPHIAPPEYKEQPQQFSEKRYEARPIDWSWLSSFLFSIKITDVLLVVFMGFVWRNTHEIWKNIHSACEASATQAQELSETAAAMDKLAKAMNAMNALNAVNKAATAKSKPGPKKKAKRGSVA